jgi:hypothetical protein
MEGHPQGLQGKEGGEKSAGFQVLKLLDQFQFTIMPNRIQPKGQGQVQSSKWGRHRCHHFHPVSNVCRPTWSQHFEQK